MTYEIYKNVVDKEKYFDEWEQSQVARLDEELKNEIYNKYLVKSEVLQRDSFTCQNVNCFKTNKALTIHHVRAKRNGGQDKARNLVTLCRSCHDHYEKGKGPITFAENATHLPNHIKGHTFRLHKEEQINWKAIKAHTKKIRKELKYGGFKKTTVEWKYIAMLLKFLEHPYDNV